MKTIQLVLSAALFLFIAEISAQNFSIEDIETGRSTYLSPETLDNLQWAGNRNLIFSIGDSLYKYEIYKREKEYLLALSDINNILALEGDDILSEEILIHYTDNNTLFFQLREKGYFFNFETHEYQSCPVHMSTEDFLVHGKSGMIAYTAEGNVYIAAPNGCLQVSYDSVYGISNGSLAYRNEFGIEHGMTWSPNGNFLAYYKTDERNVSEYPLVDIQGPMAKLVPTPYPMAGEQMENSEIWIFSIKDEVSYKLDIKKDAGVYHTNIAWSADESSIYIQHLNRGQDTMLLRSYSSHTGSFKAEFFSEIHEKYVEPEYPVISLSGRNEDFLFLSERSGYNHLYLYSATESKVEQLTEGNWEIVEFKGLDKKEKYAYFISTSNSPLEKQLYKLNLENKKLLQLTSGKGTHEVLLNSDRSFFVDLYSAIDVPNVIRLCDNKGNIQDKILQADNPLKDYKLSVPEIGTLTAADGVTDLYYKLTKPVDFNPDKKYPLIVYVYGGPHVQLIEDNWIDRIGYLQQYLAQQGYASFILDPRGSAYRGIEFENVVHQQLGVPQLEDQMEGVKFIKAINWVDTTRLGVHGWSFGGYMTIGMMLEVPGTFQVGVAGGAVTNWEYYEVMYGERYMDTPEQNPAGYALTNLNTKADKLDGKLLLIHGAMDDVVVWQHSLQFIESCIQAGKQVDYFVYPLHEHNVVGKDREHLTEMITRYFIDNL